MVAVSTIPAPPKSYTPYGAVRSVWSCKAKRVLCDGPAGTGKTRGILEKVSLAARKYPGARFLMVRKTRASMTESVLVTLERYVLVDSAGDPEPWVTPMQRRTRHSYVLPNGSEIVVGGMDNSDRILSSEYDVIVFFEATESTESDLDTLTTRLRNGVMPYQQLICDCNPSNPSHHLKRAADAGRMVRFPSRHEDNPKLWDMDLQDWTPQGLDYLDTLQALTGHRRARFLEGHWAASEGLVYPAFDPSVHVIKKMPDGWESWRKIRSIDFGHTNPFVCQWWAIDGDGRMYLYREIYYTKRIVEDHAKQINSYTEAIDATVADHDAEDRATLAAKGIATIKAVKAINPGIEAVSARLRIQADGKPRLYFLSDAIVEYDAELDSAKKPVGTVAEMDCYVYPNRREGKAEKEEPVKDHDHGMDAMRYAVAYVDGLGAAGAWVGVADGRATASHQSSSTGGGWVGCARDDFMWRAV